MLASAVEIEKVDPTLIYQKYIVHVEINMIDACIMKATDRPPDCQPIDGSACIHALGQAHA